MEYGLVSPTQLNTVNFTLPTEPAFNAQVWGTRFKGKVKFGLPRWGAKEWLGQLYPHKLKESDYLHHYIHHFNTVEVSPTHYSLVGEARISAWAHQTKGKTFKFCPKMFNGITHKGPLGPKDLLVEQFCDQIRYFGENLGPVFIQVSENYTAAKRNDLELFLDALPSDIQFFLEVRDQSWFKDERLFEELRRRKIGAVITDTAGERHACHMHLTIPKTFIRFVTNNLHPSDFERTDAWAHRINDWLNKGIEEVYFFIHMRDEKYSLDIAQYAIQKFNEIANANLAPLQMINNDPTLF